MNVAVCQQNYQMMKKCDYQLNETSEQFRG
jgi:hypothetical protein